MFKRIMGSLFEIRRFNLEEMKKIDQDFPHPEGIIEAGVYWRELDEPSREPNAPVGPFATFDLAAKDAENFCKKFSETPK